jgi:hypothetical protein
VNRASRLGYPDIGRYYWYHTVELPEGLVAAGWYDFRESLSSFPVLQDMHGMRVLDVGAASGSSLSNSRDAVRRSSRSNFLHLRRWIDFLGRMLKAPSASSGE